MDGFFSHFAASRLRERPCSRYPSMIGAREGAKTRRKGKGGHRMGMFSSPTSRQAVEQLGAFVGRLTEINWKGTRLRKPVVRMRVIDFQSSSPLV